MDYNKYDVIVIGLGPSSIFLAYELIKLKKYKKVSFIIWLVQCCLLVVFFVYKSYQFSTIMLYTHIVIVIAAVAQTMSETKNR